MSTFVDLLDSSNKRNNRSILLVHGYVREFSKGFHKDQIIPGEVVTICWQHFFISFTSAIITKDKDLDTFFNLLSKKISNERMENAKLLYRATRDCRKDSTFPYNKLADKGPYLFIIESTDGYVFGGYCTTNIVENKRLEYLNDEDAFVWVLKGVKAQKPAIYSILKGGKDATFFDAYDYFWGFGPGPSGADVLIYPPKWNKETKKIETHYNFCPTNHGTLKYEIPKKRSLVGTSLRYIFDLSDLEIYNV